MSHKKLPLRVVDGGTGATTASGARTNLAVSATTAVMLLDGTQPMTADMQLGSNKITGLATGISGTDAINKNQLDAAVAGARDPKDSCRVATTGASITLAGGAPSTLDGVSLAANDRILVKDQSTASQNGLYYVSTLGSGANGTWTRTTDADTSAEVTSGLATWVTEGTANAASGWVLSTIDTITLGTTSLTFVQVSGLGQVTAGAGLTKTGNTIDVGSGTGITVNANDIQISATYAGQATITTVGTVVTGVWQGTKIDVAYGGTNATSASGARTSLSAAPNTPVFWVGASNGELSNAVVPAGGTGISLTASTGAIAVDTTVVATTSNVLTMASKTLTSPIVNTPKITRNILTKTNDYTLLSTDVDSLVTVTFNISSQKTLTLCTSASIIGQRFTVKNRPGSSANLIVTPAGVENLEGANASFTLYPGDALEIESDGTEMYVI